MRSIDLDTLAHITGGAAPTTNNLAAWLPQGGASRSTPPGPSGVTAKPHYSIPSSSPPLGGPSRTPNVLDSRDHNRGPMIDGIFSAMGL